MDRARSFGVDIRPLFEFEYETAEGGAYRLIAKCFMADQSTWIRTYPNKERLILGARCEMYNVLWYHLEKYVNHSAMIIKNSKHYVSPKVEQSLDQSKKFVEWVAGNIYNIEALIKKINVMNVHLHAIMPHQQNDSYNSSLARLESIMIRANNIDQQLIFAPLCT